MELLAVGPARAGFRADGCVRQKGKDGLAQRRHGAVAARLQPRADGAAVPAGDEALQLLPGLVLNGDLADLAVRAEQHAHEHKRRFRRSLCGLYVRCAQALRRENGAHQAHGGGDGDRHEQNGAAKPCCFLLHDFCLLR